MAVEVLGVGQEIDGHGDSMEAFRNANHSNANALLNVTEGKKKNAPRAPHDSNHPDNQWPVMLYHAEKGEKIFGRPLLGLTDPADRKRVLSDNQDALKAAKADGWRLEPYRKPQIVVLDPAIEKAEMLRKNQEMQGQITALSDLVRKLMETKPAA